MLADQFHRNLHGIRRFFGFQARPGERGIKLVLNTGIFYEFIPFNEENFTSDGEVKPNPKAYMIHEVVEDVEYAVMLSTCAGAWRYLIGDVVKFTSVKEHEIVIVGRTKQFLSLCGEQHEYRQHEQGDRYGTEEDG